MSGTLPGVQMLKIKKGGDNYFYEEEGIELKPAEIAMHPVKHQIAKLFSKLCMGQGWAAFKFSEHKNCDEF